MTVALVGPPGGRSRVAEHRGRPTAGRLAASIINACRRVGDIVIDMGHERQRGKNEEEKTKHMQLTLSNFLRGSPGRAESETSRELQGDSASVCERATR